MSIEQTLIIFKPDAVANHQVTQILKCIPDDYNFTDCRVYYPYMDNNVNKIKAHYKEHEGKAFYPQLIDFMISGPVMVFIFEKENAINDFRKDMLPMIRTIFNTGSLKCENVIHASDSKEAAEREIGIWFKDTLNHCCGEKGFSTMLGDTCPKCKKDEAERDRYLV